MAVAKRADVGVSMRELGRHVGRRGDTFPSIGKRAALAVPSSAASSMTTFALCRRPSVRTKGRQRAKRVGHPEGVFRSLGSLVSRRV